MTHSTRFILNKEVDSAGRWSDIVIVYQADVNVIRGQESESEKKPASYLASANLANKN